jgi:hypothetical protein
MGLFIVGFVREAPQRAHGRAEVDSAEQDYRASLEAHQVLAPPITDEWQNLSTDCAPLSPGALHTSSHVQSQWKNALESGLNAAAGARLCSKRGSRFLLHPRRQVASIPLLRADGPQMDSKVREKYNEFTEYLRSHGYYTVRSHAFCVGPSLRKSPPTLLMPMYRFQFSLDCSTN